MMSPNTRRATLALVVALTLGTSSLVGAAEAPPDNKPAGPVDPKAGLTLSDLSNASALSQTMSLTEDGRLLAQASTENLDMTSDVLGYEPKSPRRAFLQSFVVPGWGQWYNGSRIKPFLFLGLEAAGWLGWSNFRGNGKDLEDKYRAYVDEIVSTEYVDQQPRWDYDKYLEGLEQVYGITSDTMTYQIIVDNVVEEKVFSHHVYEDENGNPIKDNTYYENVGKYDQFVFGWADFDNDAVESPLDSTVNYVTEYRHSYLGQRDHANREFSKASTVLILTIGNHILSAVEAALSAKRYNKSMDQFGTIDADLRLTQANINDRLRPTLTLRYRF
jgi:hypothetical protein